MKNKPFFKHTETIALKAFETLLKRHYLDVFFTSAEIVAYGQEKRLRSLGVRWLAKKMIIALLEENHIAGICFTDLSILSMPKGKPQLQIRTNEELPTIHISLSHTRNLLTALIIIEKKDSKQEQPA